MHIIFMTRFTEKIAQDKIVIECKLRGHEVSIISPADVSFVCDGRKNPMLLKGLPFPESDIIFPYWKRKDSYMWDVLSFLENSGYMVINSPTTISPDKRSIALTFAKHNINQPKTWSINTQQNLICALNDIKPPYVFKESHSSRGTKVFKIDTHKQAFTVGSILIDNARDFVIQEMIQPSGTDIRALVVGNKVVAAMERTAVNGDFRANMCQGATAVNVRLTNDEEATAVKISKIFGCLISGVDFMRTKNGAVYLEINKKPGLKGIENASKVNIAPLIIDELENMLHQKQKVA